MDRLLRRDLEHSRRFWVSGVGTDGQLAAVRGQPATESLPRADRRARRDAASALEAGRPFRHPAQTLCQAPPRRASRAGRRKLALGAQALAGTPPHRSVDPPLCRAGVSGAVRRERLLAGAAAYAGARAAGHQRRQVDDRLPRRCRSRLADGPGSGIGLARGRCRPRPAGSTGFCRTNARCWPRR